MLRTRSTSVILYPEYDIGALDACVHEHVLHARDASHIRAKARSIGASARGGGHRRQEKTLSFHNSAASQRSARYRRESRARTAAAVIRRSSQMHVARARQPSDASRSKHVVHPSKRRNARRSTVPMCSGAAGRCFASQSSARRGARCDNVRLGTFASVTGCGRRVRIATDAGASVCTTPNAMTFVRSASRRGA